MRILAFVLVLSLPGVAIAQAPACTDSSVHLEFQVTAPARWVMDPTASVHPTPAVRDPANLIQFVVDTNGVPESRAFRAIKIADSAVVAAARRAFQEWRFSPAVLGGCRVRQLVQTPVGR